MTAFIDFLFGLFCSIFGFCSETTCRTVTHADSAHTVCSYRIDSVDVNLHLLDADDQAYGRLSNLNASMANKPLMLMNGGMYHDNLDAVGLYVEKGVEAQKISTKGGWGNFHLLPNGVFWGKDGRLGVTETKTYIKRGIMPDFATQSGPMLVIEGKLHRRFLVDSDSRKIRNGVGISRDGKTIHFAISHRAVTFWEFGTLFRDQLKTPNALFLDGTVSSIQTAGTKRGGWRQIGPIISVSAKRPN